MVDKNHNVTHTVLALSRFAGVGPRLFEALLHRYGSLERIVRADSGSLMAIEGMSAEDANRITGATGFLAEAAEYHAALAERDIQVETRFGDSYPERFFELNDPPPLMYVRGRMPDCKQKILAIAGTQAATNEGIELTVHLAGACAAAGVQVVSMLKKGISVAAHLGARAANGASYALIESGFDHIDATEEIPVAIDIIQSAGILSEHPPEKNPEKHSFRAANRLLAGLVQAVVITEVYKGSKRTWDLLSCCSQIGKLTFVLIDPRHGARADKESLDRAVSCGAILMVGLDKIDDIVKSLV